MRLVDLSVRSFRAVENSVFSMGPFVVLFGANSTGKSTVLDALQLLLDPPDDDDEQQVRLPDAALVVELDCVDVPDHPDEQAWHRLLTLEGIGKGAEGEPGWGTPPLSEVIDPDLVPEIREAPRGAAAELVATALAAGVNRNAEAQSVIAAYALSAPFLAITPKAIYHYLPASGSVPDDVVRAAGALEGDSECSSPIDQWAEGIRRATGVVGPLLATRPEPLLQLPVAAVLDTDPSGIETELRAALVDAHDTLYSYVTVLKAFDPVLISTRLGRVGEAQLDTWLEAQPTSPPAEEELAAALDAGEFQISGQVPAKFMRANVSLDLDGFVAATYYDPSAWYRVKPTLLATARLLSELATDLAPTFVRDAGLIEIEVLPPNVWETHPARVRVWFAHHDGTRQPLDRLGSGFARWITATLRLLARRIADSTQAYAATALARFDSEEVEGEQIDALISEARERADTSELVTLAPPDDDLGVLWLVDEPEAHLHPRAVASVASWLQERSVDSAGVVVASHHPALVELLRDATRLVLSQRRDGVAVLAPIDSNLRRELEVVADDVGLRASDLLLLARMVLFVEGPHDEAVLEEFVGEELAAMGVVVLSMHGTDNLQGLVESEVLGALGIPLAVLTDHTDPRRVSGETGQSKEERAVQRLVREARTAGRPISPFGLRRADVVMYLSDEVCGEQAPRFPGWKAAEQEWLRTSRQTPFKPWLAERYRLRLGRSDVRRMAAETRLRGEVPKEFTRLLRDIRRALIPEHD